MWAWTQLRGRGNERGLGQLHSEAGEGVNVGVDERFEVAAAFTFGFKRL